MVQWLKQWPKPSITMKQIAAIGITNQRETTVCGNEAPANQFINAIVWQDRRTAAYCDELKAAGHANTDPGKNRIGHRCLFFRHQIEMDSDNVSGAREKAENGELLLAPLIAGWCGN